MTTLGFPVPLPLLYQVDTRRGTFIVTTYLVSVRESILTFLALSNLKAPSTAFRLVRSRIFSRSKSHWTLISIPSRSLFLFTPSRSLSLFVPSRSLFLFTPSRSLSLSVPSRSLALFIPSRSLALFVPSRSLSLSVPGPSFPFVPLLTVLPLTAIFNSGFGGGSSSGGAALFISLLYINRTAMICLQM